jgi:ABC-type multidrug transport system fused ATPase/permease subunit
VIRSADQDEAPPPSTAAVLKRLSVFARPHWKAIAFCLLLVGGQVAFELFKPWPMAVIMDNILFPVPSLEGSNAWLLVAMLALIVGAAALDGLLSYKQTEAINLAGRTIVFDLRQALFERVQRLSLQQHGRRQTGDLMTRVTSDVKALKDVFTDSIVETVYGMVYLIGMLVILFWVDWQLALAGMIAVPVLFLLLYRYTREIRRLSRIERRREGALASVLHETLGAMRLTHIFDQRNAAGRRFHEESYASLQTAYEATMTGARFGWTADLVRTVVTAGVLGFGVYQVTTGRISPGELLVVYGYVRGIYRPLRKMMQQINTINRSMARAERVVELLDSEDGVVDLPGARTAPSFQGKITFQNVSFEYEPGRLVLHSLDVAAPAGQVTALVGPTGVGKTTLASLIPRLYDPTEGAVLIDGVDIREYTLASLRSQISMVLQESVLFRASVAENIAYGRPDATVDEIVAAATAANAHEFITSLKDGYDTEIGERGETVSGGQRQRIAIARAMVRNAPVLILDEPLVGLDIESQTAVLEALERLMAGRTVILITHQLSTVERADNVIVLEAGRVVEHGDVRRLARADSKYRQLVQAERGDVVATSR